MATSSLRRSAIQQQHQSQLPVTTPKRNPVIGSIGSSGVGTGGNIAAHKLEVNTPASVASDAEYFTPKILRAAEARLVDEIGSEILLIDAEEDVEKVGSVDIETKVRMGPGESPGFSTQPKESSSTSSPLTSTARTGNHFWFGCGKLKKKVEGIRAKTMRLRAEISSRSIKGAGKIVPHPDNWIKANMPTATIDPVTDEHAYWHGCAKCAWELEQHKRIHREAQKVIAEDDRNVRKRREDSLYLV